MCACVCSCLCVSSRMYAGAFVRVLACAFAPSVALTLRACGAQSQELLPLRAGLGEEAGLRTDSRLGAQARQGRPMPRVSAHRQMAAASSVGSSLMRKCCGGGGCEPIAPRHRPVDPSATHAASPLRAAPPTLYHPYAPMHPHIHSSTVARADSRPPSADRPTDRPIATSLPLHEEVRRGVPL